jgi:glycosyltransferase involved in cell wall biosynthesis
MPSISQKFQLTSRTDFRNRLSTRQGMSRFGLPRTLVLWYLVESDCQHYVNCGLGCMMVERDLKFGLNGPFLNYSEPAISVLMPVYNAERYLLAAVESLLAQTFEDFELLVLDDGSTDNSLSILREFEANDSRIRVRSRENRGLVASLNELIAIARGRYLARMDSDDVCRPQRFARQITYLDAHPECVAAGTRVLFIDPEGMPIFAPDNKLTHEEIDSGHMSGVRGMRICHPSVMMRKAAVMQVGKYRDRRFAEDLDLFLRLAEIGRLANLPEVLFEYRQHFDSLCYVHHDESSQFARLAIEDACKRRGVAIKSTTEATFKPERPAETHRKWVWWALSAGNLATARRHAIKALAIEPFSIKNMKTVACAIRGH